MKVFIPRVAPKRPIRIAVLGDWDKYFSYFLNGMQEGAIRNGCWFRPLNIRSSWDTIKANIWEFRPDILGCHMIFSKEPHGPEKHLEEFAKFKKTLGTIIFYHAGDARREPRYTKDISRSIDFCLVNQTECLTKFSNYWRVPCYYWPYGCLYQDKIAAVDSRFEHDLVFTGRLSASPGSIHSHRTEFIGKLKELIPITIYPNKDYPDTKLLTAEISASSKAILGVCAGYDINGYMDVRPFQYPGAGAFLLQRKYKNMERVFIDKQHMVMFRDDEPEHFVDLYQGWMKKSKEISEIRQTAFVFLQRHHSYANRVRDILNIVYGIHNNTKIFLEDVP